MDGHQTLVDLTSKIITNYSVASSQPNKTETDHCYSLNLEQLEWEMPKYKGPLPNSTIIK